MTQNEMTFYQKLLEIEKRGDYIVFPQINLASIIDKETSTFHNELFRNIDFGIFNSKFEILLLIELNDATHNETKRKIRDAKVKDICNSAHIPLLFFYTKYPNEKEYILNRILNILEKKEIHEKQENSYSTPD